MSPQLDRPTPIVSIPPLQSEVLWDAWGIWSLIQENKSPETGKFHEGMVRAMESRTNSTQRNMKKHQPTVHSLCSFVVLIARSYSRFVVIKRA